MNTQALCEMYFRRMKLCMYGIYGGAGILVLLAISNLSLPKPLLSSAFILWVFAALLYPYYMVQCISLFGRYAWYVYCALWFFIPGIGTLVTFLMLRSAYIQGIQTMQRDGPKTPASELPDPSNYTD